MTRQVSYTDEKGRKWAVLLPDGLPDTDASMGIPIGPPSLEPLGLPEEVEIRLHNQLFDRRILTLADVKARRRDIFGALQATFRVDTERIAELYVEEGGSNGQQPRQERKKVTAPKARGSSKVRRKA